MGAGDAAEWLLHAESDLTYAKLGQAEPAILRNQVTFHAQQAAEKAFKAALVHAAVEFPKTHDLQTLLLLLRNSGISVGQEIEQAATLTRFAVEARYPGGDRADHIGRVGPGDRAGREIRKMGAGPDIRSLRAPVRTRNRAPVSLKPRGSKSECEVVPASALCPVR